MNNTILTILIILIIALVGFGFWYFTADRSQDSNRIEIKLPREDAPTQETSGGIIFLQDNSIRSAAL